MTGFDTRAIHAGQQPDPATGAVNVPIYATSTYAQDGVGGLRTGLGEGFEYSRSGNPTRAALERSLAAIDSGSRGLAFASGLAAEDCLLRATLAPGDHVIIPDDAYGGTYRLVARVFGRWGITYTPVALGDLAAVRDAIRPTTRLLWCETPTNPLLGIADIAGLAAVAHNADAVLAVDNTFASPALQQPLSLGADAVVHSTTKYLGGHSDVIGGALVIAAGRDELAENLAFHQNALGGVPSPFDCFLTLRGIKTLGIRMERHCANARVVVEMLTKHPAVQHVLYPGLTEHPGHAIAAKQMRDFGGMVSFRLAGGESAALDVCKRLRLFTLAESLGGVESLVEHPARMTHASVTSSALEVPDDLVRLSVGIETAADLVADLAQALG